MNELRKTLLAAIIISLIVGAAAGATGGIMATQFAYGDLGQTLLSALPQSIRQVVRLPDKSEEVQNGGPLAPPARPPATDEEAATTEVVRRVAPAVVSILITKEVTPLSTGPLFPEEILREFGFPFEIEVPRSESGQPQKREVGGGTGFIVTTDGLITTNKHVVFDDAAEYTVVTSDGKKYPAKVMARDPFQDVALIKIEGQNFPTVKFGNSDTLRLGETVIAIGNALSEFSNSVTKGIVSGINRRVVAGGSGIGTEVLEEAIQTDAAINPGNSGGPLVNLRGEVVGINTAVSSQGQLIGFAIPINVAKPIIESVKTTGRIIRPWLGVRYMIITPEFKTENSLPVDYGVLVARGSRQTDLAVIPGSPADKAGLRENDIILEMDGVKITQEVSLARQIQKHKVGDVVKLKVLRQGEEQEIKVELEEMRQ